MSSADLTGELFLAGDRRDGGSSALLHSHDPRSGERLEPGYRAAAPEDIAAACAAAAESFASYRAVPVERRAEFLRRIAEEIEGDASRIIARGVAETGLPEARLKGEVGRTAGQLRLFADLIVDGRPADVRIDHADESGPELRSQTVGIGPVAVFAASNFPLAFSVAGGDTASALAAGCPVVVKAHEAHLGVSELVAAAVVRAVRASDVPAGVFSMVVGEGREVGQALVKDEHIRAVGFTGSQAVGLAIVASAAERTEPIPVYAEMSSVNPCFVLSHALEQRAEEIASAFVDSLTLGAGQFCTNPGLLVLPKGAAADRFIAAASERLRASPPQTMLSARIHRSFEEDVAARASHPDLTTLVGPTMEKTGGPHEASGSLFATDAALFLRRPELQNEVFGPSGVVVQCDSEAELESVANALSGQLTASLHADPGDEAMVRRLLPRIESVVGRLIFNAWPTGVRVCDAMVHGGPFPATSAPGTTSVGARAIDRFLRPVSYQGFPSWALPDVLRDEHVVAWPRRVDGDNLVP